jgi:multidrug resistance efflux pump
VQALEANLREAEARSALIGVQLDRTAIHAPFAGTITRKSVELGEVITSGTPVCTLTDLGDLKVKVYLPERDLSAVNVNQAVEIHLDGRPAAPQPGASDRSRRPRSSCRRTWRPPRVAPSRCSRSGWRSTRRPRRSSPA